jgi:hypothetical protein
MAKHNRSQKQFVDQNPVEALRDITSKVGASMANDLLKESMADAWKQFLGAETAAKGENKFIGDLAEGVEINLKTVSQNQKTKETSSMADIEPGIDYRREVIHTEKRVAVEDNRALHSKIQEIQVEILKIIESSKELKVQFKQVTQETIPENPGKYHLSFLEWILSVVSSARQRIETSSAWVSAIQTKKKQKGYWNLFKKHGTQFGLSGERVVATQVG